MCHLKYEFSTNPLKDVTFQCAFFHFTASQYVYSNAANPTLARYDPYALENVRPAYFNQNIPVYPNLQANNIYSTSQSHYSLLNGQDASQIIAAQQNSSSDVSPMGTTATYDAARMCASSPASDHAMTAEQRQGGVSQTVHMIPETLVTGAVNVASSAINTARSVLNMLAPARGEVSSSDKFEVTSLTLPRS